MPGDPYKNRFDTQLYGISWPGFNSLSFTCDGPCTTFAHELGHCGHYQAPRKNWCNNKSIHHNDPHNLMCCGEKAKDDPDTTYVDDQWCDAVKRLVK